MSDKSLKKNFIGILFKCCEIYARIYINNLGDAYEGRCPGCLRYLTVRIDKENGVNDRFFVAY